MKHLKSGNAYDTTDADSLAIMQSQVHIRHTVTYIGGFGGVTLPNLLQRYTHRARAKFGKNYIKSVEALKIFSNSNVL